MTIFVFEISSATFGHHSEGNKKKTQKRDKQDLDQIQTMQMKSRPWPSYRLEFTSLIVQNRSQSGSYWCPSWPWSESRSQFSLGPDGCRKGPLPKFKVSMLRTNNWKRFRLAQTCSSEFKLVELWFDRRNNDSNQRISNSCTIRYIVGQLPKSTS